MESPSRSRKKQPRIILIGRRKGAIAAARELGLKPVTIDVQARREQSISAYGGTVNRALTEALKACPASPPVSAVAVATGSVMAAAAIREHFSLPGISSEIALSCHDKLVMKKAISSAGIPCAPWLETTGQTTPGQLIDQLGLPLLLKVPISSGGRGVWICNSAEEISAHLRPGLLAEGFIEGVEMSVETFRAHGKALFRNYTGYLVPRVANVLPANLSPRQQSALEGFAEDVHQRLKIDTGMTHLEIFLGPNGPVFSEIAARPPGGYLMELIGRAYSINPWKTLLQIALGESPDLERSALQHAGVWLFHPGEGTVERVEGLENIRSISGIKDAVCSLEPGDHITARIGSGESVGRIIAESSSYDACASTLKAAAARLQITLAK